MTSDAEHLFVYLLGHLYVFYGKMSTEFCQFVNQTVFAIELISSLYIWCIIPYQNQDFKIFSPIR